MQPSLGIQRTGYEYTLQAGAGDKSSERNVYKSVCSPSVQTSFVPPSKLFSNSQITKLNPEMQGGLPVVCKVRDTNPTQQPAGSVQLSPLGGGLLLPLHEFSSPHYGHILSFS